ncbi:hypothetical protein N665_0162s0069 [Sinapis alba]|nr:hypothetical protein N665_0162s0069 [Sinapis alba]
MVATRWGKRKKNTTEGEAKKAKSGAPKSVRMKFVRTASSMTLEKTTKEKTETMAVEIVESTKKIMDDSTEKTTNNLTEKTMNDLIEKATEIMEPIIVLVESTAATVSKGTCRPFPSAPPAILEIGTDSGEDKETSSDEEQETTSDEDTNSDGTEASEVIKPCRIFFNPYEYKKKLRTRCLITYAIKTLANPKPKLTNVEMIYNKRRQVWFIMNGVPICYRLREHALISRLNCHNYPLSYKEYGETKFVDRHFKEGEFKRLEDVKAKLVNIRPHRKKLKMAVLFFLVSVVCTQTNVRYITKDVLELTFPWGRYSYDYMSKEISHTLNHFEGLVKENTLWPLPGFCVPLEVFRKLFREPVEGADVNSRRMCKSTFKQNGMRGVSLSMINKEMGDETGSFPLFFDIDNIIPTKTSKEEKLLDDIMEDEDDVDEPDIVVDS